METDRWIGVVSTVMRMLSEASISEQWVVTERKKTVAISGKNKLQSLGTVIIIIYNNLMSQIISNKDILHIFPS